MFKKIFVGIMFFSLLSTQLAFAESLDGHVAAQQLIEQEVDCSDLTDDQLALIGDYYMEQMAGDETRHEAMDQMMGGEDSESLREMHILMAHRWYCGDDLGLGMMGMMNGDYVMGVRGGDRKFNSMMDDDYSGAGMMNWKDSGSKNYAAYNNGYGMMGGQMMYGAGYGTVVWMIVLYIITAIFLVTGIAAFVKYLSRKD